MSQQCPLQACPNALKHLAVCLVPSGLYLEAPLRSFIRRINRDWSIHTMTHCSATGLKALLPDTHADCAVDGGRTETAYLKPWFDKMEMHQPVPLDFWVLFCILWDITTAWLCHLVFEWWKAWVCLQNEGVGQWFSSWPFPWVPLPNYRNTCNPSWDGRIFINMKAMG